MVVIRVMVGVSVRAGEYSLFTPILLQTQTVDERVIN